MDPIFRQKLEELRQYYYNDDPYLKWIDTVEKNIRTLIAREKLSENASVKAIIKDAKSRVEAIDQLLSNKEDMTEVERMRYFRDKYVHQFYLDRFEGTRIATRMDTIKGEVNEELAKIGKSTA